MMINNNDPTFNARLQAFYDSPAHGRVKECIAAMHLLYGAALEYEQEIEAHLERYMLHLDNIERAQAHLDSAFDRFEAQLRSLYNDRAATPLNLTGEMLRRWMERRISEGLPTTAEEGEL